MSNRSHLEFNHDYWFHIEDRPEEFAKALLRYLNCADERNREGLKVYGVTVLGMRHHSEPRPSIDPEARR